MGLCMKRSWAVDKHSHTAYMVIGCEQTLVGEPVLSSAVSTCPMLEITRPDPPVFELDPSMTAVAMTKGVRSSINTTRHMSLSLQRQSRGRHTADTEACTGWKKGSVTRR